MSHCADCGTRLEKNGVCPNCDEEAFIMDWQGEFLPPKLSQEFTDAADDGYKRAVKRNCNCSECTGVM